MLILIILSWIITIGMAVHFTRRARQSENLKQEFITVATHKFRTPLTGIKWATAMLHDNISFQRKEDLLKEIERAGDRIVEIVDMLTEFATISNSNRSAQTLVSLRSLVEKTLQKYAQFIRDKKMIFDIAAANDVPSLLLDKNRIQFVLDVLIENAIKYTTAGGLIKINLAREREYVLLSLADSGIGFRSGESRHLFKKFWRGEEAKKIDTEGMGLGLSTAWTIVDRDRGYLWAESPGPGLGATFYLKLPITGYDFKFK